MKINDKLFNIVLFRFRFIERLLLVHGHWSYDRNLTIFFTEFAFKKQNNAYNKVTNWWYVFFIAYLVGTFRQCLLVYKKMKAKNKGATPAILFSKKKSYINDIYWISIRFATQFKSKLCPIRGLTHSLDDLSYAINSIFPFIQPG